jgi:hypothetical protein
MALRAMLAILVVHTVLLAWSGHAHSPVSSEVGHLPSGVSHWRFGHFDLYRVNPPLVRMIAALPVLLANPATDWSSYSPYPTVRSESSVGNDFINANGQRSFWLYTLGRWACIPFSWIGAYVCYRWARDLYGVTSGLVAMLLWSFCPNVLGNGALIMPDLPAAALGAAACYTFWTWLKEPTWLRTFTAGAVLGLAELAKTTLTVLYLLWPALWILYRLPERRSMTVRDWLREAAMIGARMLIGVVIVNLGYAFEGSLQRLGDYPFESLALTAADGSDSEAPRRNRFADTWLASVPVPLPKNYVQGIDTQRSDFERGKISYLRGVWQDHGWWYFYLYAMAIKIPLGTWLLLLLAVLETFASRNRGILWRDELVLLSPLAVVLALVSSQTGFSAHFRYALPVVPYLLIFASKALQRLSVAGAAHFDQPPGSAVVGNAEPAIAIAGVVALSWSLCSSLWCYPHELGYFNELAGGPRRGGEHLLDSSIAWGQDLLYLKDWYERHPEARPLGVAAWGGVQPGIAGIDFQLPPLGPASPRAPEGADHQKLGPKPGWFAIDVNFIHGSKRAMLVDPPSPNNPQGLDLSYFSRFEPIGAAGTSVFIFHISQDEANRVRHELGLDKLAESEPGD